MRRPWKRTVFTLSACVASISGSARAQSIITGVVRDDSAATPLAGVEVTVEGEKRATRTDASGRYFIQSPTGPHIANFRLLGYITLRTRISVKGDTTKADVTLVRTGATQLQPVKVQGAQQARGFGRAEFAERRALGIGKFADSAVLRPLDDRRLSDVLRDLVGVRTMEFHDPNSFINEIRAVSPTSSESRNTAMGTKVIPGNPACYVSIFLDGVALYRSDMTGSARPPDLSRDFSVPSLEAIEYYRGPSEVPPQYGGSNANCGALLFWTRRG